MNKVEIYYEDIQSLSIKKTSLNKLVKRLINSEMKQLGEISVILCSDKYLLEMNKQYLNHDYFTDIITFDYVEQDVISGDLFISLERVEENAKRYNANIINELCRVIFHGVLHLIGYGDKTSEEKKTMTEKENLYLSEVDFREIEL